MNGIKRYLTGLVLGKWVKPLVTWLDGKKTVSGAIALLLWCWIYAVPQVFPEYAWLADSGKYIQELLESNGVLLDKELLGAGMGLTLIGLIFKIKKIFS